MRGKKPKANKDIKLTAGALDALHDLAGEGWEKTQAAVASRATAGACGLCGRISAHVAHACSALVVVARERYLIVANAILIYKKDTERS